MRVLDEEVRRRLTIALLLSAIALLAGTYLASIGPYWNISPDSATYVGLGQSLARGEGFRDASIQPPMASIVFAGVVATFGDGYLALNALTPILIFLSLALLFVRFQGTVGTPHALLAVLLSLASTALYHESTQLQSEPTYMAFTAAALVLVGPAALSRRSGDSSGGRSRPEFEILAGVFLVAAALTRVIGATLALAVLLVEGRAFLRHERRPRILLVSFAVLALFSVAIWNALLGQHYVQDWFRMFSRVDAGYADSSSFSFARIATRLRDGARLLPATGGLLLNSWSTSHHRLDLLLQCAALLTFVVGLVLALRRRIGVMGVYVLLYVLVVTVHMVGGGFDEYRFLVPVVPFLFYYAIGAVRALFALARARRAGSGPIIALQASALLYVAVFVGSGFRFEVSGVRDAHSSPFGSYPIKRPSNLDAERLALWLRDHTSPQDQYASAQRDMFDVLTERHGLALSPVQTSPHDAFVRWLSDQQVRYLFVDHTAPGLRDSLMAVIRDYPDAFRLIERLPRESLYEVISRP